jgi:uncharacterized protein with PIN domain
MEQTTVRHLIQGSVNKPTHDTKNAKWLVILGRKTVATVYFDSEVYTTQEQVKEILVNRDGMHPDIKVYRQ